jgi:kinesin family protein 2/24
MMDSKIKVGVRIRPLNTKELDASSSAVIGSESGKFVVTKSPAKKNCFEYDWSFDSHSTNKSVYEASCKPLIENIFEGFNATFFACKSTQPPMC